MRALDCLKWNSPFKFVWSSDVIFFLLCYLQCFVNIHNFRMKKKQKLVAIKFCLHTTYLETLHSHIWIIFHGITHYRLVHRFRMNEGGGPNGLTQSRLDVSSWVSGWDSKIITRNAKFQGKEFLGNKRKSLPLYFRNNSFFHLPWLIWWLVQQQKFLLLFMLTYVCEWVRESERESKIYILFLLLFFCFLATAV